MRIQAPPFFPYNTILGRVRRFAWGGGMIALLLICDFPEARGAGVPLELRKGDVVAFVGGTDMVRMQEQGLLEAALTQRFQSARPRFRDLAWDADTVYFQGSIGERWRRGAFGDWKTQLKKVGATVVIAQFGKMESLDGAEKMEGFIRAYGKLLDQLSGEGRRLVLLAPSPFEWKGVGDRALGQYTDAIRELAAVRRIPFIPGDATDPVRAFVRGLTGNVKPPPGNLVRAVQAKHRLWYEYWRPANWKCLFGDDRRRVFSNATRGIPSFMEEWSTYTGLIEAAEAAIYSGKALEPRKPSVLTGSKEADPKKELAAFQVLDGFEVSLFADESHGVANPLSVRWDASGQMYVACSDVYPQIEPGALPNDKIILLRDTDNDGRADQSTVFADGLNIPTGMEVGRGQVYVGQGTEILVLRDKDGDGVADERRVLLSGFGNGDSHQTINTFAWSPGGELWFCQGDGIESRVETPFGVSSLYQAGVFRLRPGRLQLDGLLDDFMGPGNPWGVAFDDFGQSFVIDGAGGVSYLTPASIPAKRRLRLPRIGQPGGYCGIDCLGAGNLPKDMQGEFVIGDYKKNQVSRFAVTGDGGAGFKVVWRKPLLRSRHRNFRPIDVRVGPDGAIYIVDWYNPITCHQDDFYRHPDRDKTHGRIWRVTPKGGALKPPKLTSATIQSLVEMLDSTERWTRLKAKETLGGHDPAKVLPVVRRWASIQAATGHGHRVLEAVMLLEWLDTPDESLVRRLLGSGDYRERAYAARVAGRWGSRLKNVFQVLELAARDPHPQVRMEAVLSCGQIPDPRSAVVAATVAEGSRDRWIDYAFSQAVHHLKPQWLPAFRRGELDFGDRRRGLAAVLGQADSRGLLAETRRLLKSGELKGEGRIALVRALISVGEESDLHLALEEKPPSPVLLRALAGRERPGIEFTKPLHQILEGSHPEARVAAMELVGHWRVGELKAQCLRVAAQNGADAGLRSAAIGALGFLGGGDAVQTLESIAGTAPDMLRVSAVAALLNTNSPKAASLGAGVLSGKLKPGLETQVFSAFVEREGGGRLLADVLKDAKISRAQGERLRSAWIATGLVDPDLSRRIDALAGVSVQGLQFDGKRVTGLVAAAGKGNSRRGRALFESSRLGCLACHKVGGSGGSIGPDLTALASALPPDRIVIEVLWPRQQVKEGFSLSRVTLKDQRVLQGYVQDGRDSKVLLLRDFSTSKIERIPRGDIVRTEAVGSLMPDTAHTLPDDDLADLLAYLFGLR